MSRSGRLAASWKKLMKKFLLPFQNMVRADLFSGSLAVWNALGFAFHFARPPIPSPAKRDENRISFELFQEYTANLQFQHFGGVPDLPAGRQGGRMGRGCSRFV